MVVERQVGQLLMIDLEVRDVVLVFVEKMFDFLFVDFDLRLMPLLRFLQVAIFVFQLCFGRGQFLLSDVPEVVDFILNFQSQLNPILCSNKPGPVGKSCAPLAL